MCVLFESKKLKEKGNESRKKEKRKNLLFYSFLDG